MFRPFSPYRPHKNLVEKVISPPFNELNTQDSREYAKNNEYSFLHIIRPEIDVGKENYKLYNLKSAKKGFKTLQQFIKNNIIVKDKQPYFYLYCQENKKKSIFGIVGEIFIDAYKKNIIKPHENIIPEKVKSLTSFTEEQKAYTDPIVLSYKTSPIIKNIIEKNKEEEPDQNFLDTNNVLHKVWLIKDLNDTNNIQNFFNNISSIYIADGHHRSATALNLLNKHGNNYGYIPSILFSDDEIELLSYNRIIKNIKNIDNQTFLLKMEKYFTITPNKIENIELNKQNDVAMLYNEQWYNLLIKKEWMEKVKLTLGIEIINEYVIKNMLKILSLNYINSIECVGGKIGLGGIESKCKSNNWPLGFCFTPVSISHFKKIVDEGNLMPAKTTWFEPKICTGFFTKILE